MKKSYDVRKRFGRKNMVMCLVALILVMITVVGTSYSWIEEVSKVEFNSDNGQETPYKMKAAPLNAEANIVNNSTEIDFSKYFNEGGDMHLSPCYSDGEKFYFPVNNTSGSDKFRLGTKDDANTNYISSTFKVKAGSENTAFWFEKIEASTPYLSLKTSSGANATVSASESYLRFSVTVDGATNVYCLNSTGKYYKVSAITDASAVEATGRRLEAYAYYDPDTNSDISQQTANRNVANQNSERNNLHCNTLFTVPKGQTKVVTLKIWLECRGSGTSLNVRDVAVSNINFKLTSSWAKMRRIYVLDRTIDQEGYDSAQWLTTYNGKLSWALKSNLDTHYDLVADGTQTIGGTAYNRYYADIPNVYNGAEVVLFRCNGTYGSGNKTYKVNENTTNEQSKKCWNFWETTFPNTFHNETFHVYTSDYGTWDDYANKVYFINSCNTSEGFGANHGTPYAYMWDSASVIDSSDVDKKVVQNERWTGVPMTKTQSKTPANKNYQFDIYTFYYNAIYDRIIFNDNFGERLAQNQYQTQDLWLSGSDLDSNGQMKKPYFDMATLQWYSKPSDLPMYSNVFLKSNIRGNDNWAETRFAYSSNDVNSKYCYFYIRSNKTANNDNTYQFCINDLDSNVVWKCHKDSGWLGLNQLYECKNETDFNKNFTVSFEKKGVYVATFYTDTHKFKINLVQDLSAQ